jgi:hypothetical protein
VEPVKSTVFLEMMQHNLIDHYQHFRETYSLCLLCCTLKIEAAVSSETLVMNYQTTWHRNPEDTNLHLPRGFATITLVVFLVFPHDPVWLSH